MKKLAWFAFALGTLAPVTASADIDQFTVRIKPQHATLVYEANSISGADFGCGLAPTQCAFDLEMEMSLEVDVLGVANATVTKVELHNAQGIFATHPEQVEMLEGQVAALFADSDFVVQRGPEPGRTFMTADMLMGTDLVLEFNQAKLLTMSGGPDMRPVDGAKMTVSYAVPEPGTLVLAGLGLVALGGVVAQRRRKA